MRGQLEKLQNDKGHLEKYKAVLENSLLGKSAGDAAGTAATAGTKSQMAGIEMIVNAQEAERQRLFASNARWPCAGIVKLYFTD